MILYAIGDIHGCADKLRDLLAKIQYDTQNYPGETFELVLLGDYIDRGPDSKGVIDTILALDNSVFSKVVSLRGNHEAFLLDALNGDHAAYKDWLANGGINALYSYGLTAQNGYELYQLPKEHVEFLRATQLSYQRDHVVFVHAGIDPTLPLEEQREQILLWSRKFNNYDRMYDRGYYVVHGHTPSDHGARRLTAQVNIDTGAFAGLPLTACVIDSNGPFGNCRILNT